MVKDPDFISLPRKMYEFRKPNPSHKSKGNDKEIFWKYYFPSLSTYSVFYRNLCHVICILYKKKEISSTVKIHIVTVSSSKRSIFFTYILSCCPKLQNPFALADILQSKIKKITSIQQVLCNTKLIYIFTACIFFIFSSSSPLHQGHQQLQ